MLIAAALRALAPFSLVAGSPIFHMVSRSTLILPPGIATAARRSRKATATYSAANDGQHAAQVHCFMSAATAQRADVGQLSLLAGLDASQDAPADGKTERPTERPIDRIRLPRKPAVRRRSSVAAAASKPSAFLSVQRCSAQAANDATIKMYWAKPASLQRERGMRWAMTGTMADIFAELERLERLERSHC